MCTRENFDTPSVDRIALDFMFLTKTFPKFGKIFGENIDFKLFDIFFGKHAKSCKLLENNIKARKFELSVKFPAILFYGFL